MPAPRVRAKSSDNNFRCESCVRCQNCRFCRECEDCQACTYCDNCKRCERCTQCKRSEDCTDSNYLEDCRGCIQSSYLALCIDCRDCVHCLGCVGLDGAEFCLLNRQLSRKEYFAASRELKAHWQELVAAGELPSWWDLRDDLQRFEESTQGHPSEKALSRTSAPARPRASSSEPRSRSTSQVLAPAPSERGSRIAATQRPHLNSSIEPDVRRELRHDSQPVAQPRVNRQTRSMIPSEAARSVAPQGRPVAYSHSDERSSRRASNEYANTRSSQSLPSRHARDDRPVADAYDARGAHAAHDTHGAYDTGDTYDTYDAADQPPREQGHNQSYDFRSPPATVRPASRSSFARAQAPSSRAVETRGRSQHQEQVARRDVADARESRSVRGHDGYDVHEDDERRRAFVARSERGSHAVEQRFDNHASYPVDRVDERRDDRSRQRTRTPEPRQESHLRPRSASARSQPLPPSREEPRRYEPEIAAPTRPERSPSRWMRPAEELADYAQRTSRSAWHEPEDRQPRAPEDEVDELGLDEPVPVATPERNSLVRALLPPRRR